MLEVQVGRVEPETYFFYRWHPYAVDPSVDYSKEPTTLVEFRLEETSDGTVLTIVESGFDWRQDASKRPASASTRSRSSGTRRSAGSARS